MKIRVIIIGICVLGLITVPTTGFIGTTEQEKITQLIAYEKTAGINGEKAIKVDISPISVQTNINILGADTQVTYSEADDSHPVIDIDYNGNPFLIYHSRPDLFTSSLYMQRSPDGGITWPEELSLYWNFEDLIAINPDINFVDGVRAFGTHELVGEEPSLYIHDYVDIDDPDTWAVYYFDRSGYSSYISETAVAANKSGRIAFGSILDYEGDDYFEDTLLINWDADNFDDDTADGGVYWLNRDNDGISIPYSNLCADAGEKIFFVFQKDPIDGKSQIATAYCRVDENTLIGGKAL